MVQMRHASWVDFRLTLRGCCHDGAARHASWLWTCPPSAEDGHVKAWLRGAAWLPEEVLFSGHALLATRSALVCKHMDGLLLCPALRALELLDRVPDLLQACLHVAHVLCCPLL